jgi:hypothetical protein
MYIDLTSPMSDEEIDEQVLGGKTFNSQLVKGIIAEMVDATVAGNPSELSPLGYNLFYTSSEVIAVKREGTAHWVVKPYKRTPVGFNPSKWDPGSRVLKPKT